MRKNGSWMTSFAQKSSTISIPPGIDVSVHFLNIASALSRWCITHRKKAKQIVETWDKLFNSSQKEQRVSFLYLANDILQNSRRKGSEFVNEFWKVLPGALKHVYENGDEYGKKAVTRLVSYSILSGLLSVVCVKLICYFRF